MKILANFGFLRKQIICLGDRFFCEFSCCIYVGFGLISFDFDGRMAELVDALVSGTSGSNTLEVQVFLRPPVLGL